MGPHGSMWVLQWFVVVHYGEVGGFHGVLTKFEWSSCGLRWVGNYGMLRFLVEREEVDCGYYP